VTSDKAFIEASAALIAISNASSLELARAISPASRAASFRSWSGCLVEEELMLYPYDITVGRAAITTE
jgi:hypothetical protein